MTTKVKIVNEEGPALVRVRTFGTSQNGERYEDPGNPPVNLAPGETVERWIHGSLMLEVTEIEQGS